MLTLPGCPACLAPATELHAATYWTVCLACGWQTANEAPTFITRRLKQNYYAKRWYHQNLTRARAVNRACAARRAPQIAAYRRAHATAYAGYSHAYRLRNIATVRAKARERERARRQEANR